MSFRQIHLNKTNGGTACGRSPIRTPISVAWEAFKKVPTEQKCERCAASKQAALNARNEAK
ncbi:MAG: hypothetical protein K2Q20_11435 [Phycisphaerales bacterium]|nr:hypothetical protein [Phycisphaerales bacterium]